MFGAREVIEADLNNHFSRYEDPLWDDENVSSSSYEIKRVAKKNVSWKFIKNKELEFVLESKQFGNNEKIINWLSSVEGFQWLLAQYKQHKCLDSILSDIKSLKL